MIRRLTAEFLGSGLLVATVVGSGIMGERLSGGIEALALLGNTLATAAMLVVLILVFAPVSGAHFNPAVSLVMALRRELKAGAFLAYAGAQVLGGGLGTLLAHAMFEMPLLTLATTARAGPAQWLSEGAATFALLLAILGTKRARPEATASAVGLVIAAGYWWTASTSFANPAVTIARCLTDSFSGIRPADVPAFLAAQGVGALLAAGLARLLGPPPPP